MRCPVCKSEYAGNERDCRICGFTELNPTFLSVEEAENWKRQVVTPCRAMWKKSLQTRYRRIDEFEIVGSTLIKYNHNHLQHPSLILIPDGITTISSWAFNKVHAGYVILPKSVTTIERYAFGNSVIEHLYVPSSVEHIGMHALGNREGTNVYLDFSSPNPAWGEKYGFNFPCEWCEPFYDWDKFKTYVIDSDFSGPNDYVRCFWRDDWVDLLHGLNYKDNAICLPSKNELVIMNQKNITIVYDGYFLGDAASKDYDEECWEESEALFISLLISNGNQFTITITNYSIAGVKLKPRCETISIEPQSVEQCVLEYVATDYFARESLLDLDMEYPDWPELRFSFDLLVPGDKEKHFECDLSRLININAPGRGLYARDLEQIQELIES